MDSGVESATFTLPAFTAVPSMEPADFHRREAIAAVQDVDDDRFYDEGDEDDDLYADVNVGEGEGFFPHSPGASSASAAAASLSNSSPPPPHSPPPLPQAVAISPEAAAPPPLPPPPANGFQMQGVSLVLNGRTAASGEGTGGTTLFVGELHWWTTDADLEAELSKYGQVKDVRFFDEKASGKSRGYCQVDFFDPAVAAAARDGLHGHVFYGRPCVVALAAPQTVRRMGEAQFKNHQSMAPPPPQGPAPRGRGLVRPQGSGKFGRDSGGVGNWGERDGRGNAGSRNVLMGNARNQMGPSVGGGGGGGGIMCNGSMGAPPLGTQMLHLAGMFGRGFDPTGYRIAIGGYGGFPTGPMSAPYTGMVPSAFPLVGATHANPAFFRRGMMVGAGAGGGMWSGQGMGSGWGEEEQGNFMDDVVSEQQYGEGGYMKERASERDGLGVLNQRHEKERDVGTGSGQYWPDRRLREDRDQDRERERDYERDREREKGGYRDERDWHGNHKRYRDHEHEHDEWDRRGSARARTQSGEDDHTKRRH